MKWYIGILSQIIAAIITFGSIFYIEGQDQYSLPLPLQNAYISAVFIVGFIGGFMAPYHVMKTARTGAIAFAILAGIPLVFVLDAAGEVSQDDSGDIGAILVLILLIVVAIVLVISIIVVTVLLFVGGYIGSIFGKMVFERDRFEENFKPSKYHNPKKG
ncbi:MAG: hypothetical protein HeimC2_26470 [Candidatus Heimdallarchaeota archaeon LC_2]|nr:MAG: hypothetical protein HeimC2_26470 [Candidatus Heimdallarchaeota archaeon LC_2]